jgi:cation transport protein ChaC
VAREVPKPAGPSDYTPLTDADFSDLADRYLAELGGEGFWVFAYGSLIWKPGFDHVEARRGVVHGWRKSFCLNLNSWRGTPEEPGLMLALQRGGSCKGVAYRMPPDDPKGRMLRLLHREMANHEDVPWQRCLTVRTAEGPIRALVFYCAHDGDPDALHLPIEEQARRLARAVGYMGSCAEYLFNTVSHLEALGMCDRDLWDLQARVAAEIERL